MKLAVLGESSADEAAIRILVDSILAQETGIIAEPRLKTRGWPSVREVLPVVLKHLHYQTDADALIVVVDSDHSPLHLPSHKQSEFAESKCRACELREICGRTARRLRPIAGRTPPRFAVGLAVPSIEAWYCCRRDPHVSESAWSLGLGTGVYPYTKRSLKQDIYGTDRPSIELETSCATKEARLLATDRSRLETLFPGGFGALVNDVCSWVPGN